MSAHTKGPWTIAPKKTWSASIGLVVTGKPTPVAWASRLAKGGDDEAQANARLIAAAPELLEALREAEEWMSSGNAIPVDGWGIRNKSADAERGIIVERIRAAIAKAEGKS